MINRLKYILDTAKLFEQAEQEQNAVAQHNAMKRLGETLRIIYEELENLHEESE